MRICVSHHCDCREAQFKKMREALEILEGEFCREAFRINTYSVAISILKRKLAERESGGPKE